MAPDSSPRALLERIGLGQYADAFESNQIELSDLLGLTLDDLKELGVAVLGHRKRIITEIQGTSPVTGSTADPPVPAPRSKAKDEFSYLEKKVAMEDGGWAAVKITSRRAILGLKTYALQNISAVEAYNNKEELESEYELKCMEIEELNTSVYERWKKERQDGVFKRWGLIIGGILVVFMGFVLLVVSADTTSPAVCCGLLGVALIFAGSQVKVPPEPERLPPPQRAPLTWSVRIQSAGVDEDVITSRNRKAIEEIVDSLNKAIVNLNM